MLNTRFQQDWKADRIQLRIGLTARLLLDNANIFQKEGRGSINRISRATLLSKAKTRASYRSHQCTMESLRGISHARGWSGTYLGLGPASVPHTQTIQQHET